MFLLGVCPLEHVIKPDLSRLIEVLARRVVCAICSRRLGSQELVQRRLCFSCRLPYILSLGSVVGFLAEPLVAQLVCLTWLDRHLLLFFNTWFSFARFTVFAQWSFKWLPWARNNGQLVDDVSRINFCKIFRRTGLVVQFVFAWQLDVDISFYKSAITIDVIDIPLQNFWRCNLLLDLYWRFVLRLRLSCRLAML